MISSTDIEIEDLKTAIEHYSQKVSLTTEDQSALQPIIMAIISKLEQGKLRVAEPWHLSWQVNTWLKQAILLYFRIFGNQLSSNGLSQFYDKIPLQFRDTSADELKTRNLRLVPQACVRAGAFIGDNCVLMPSYVNIGAYIGAGSMIDTWATIGSCAQIGKNVHISGGAGIGGVLEPLQANPTIIEDDCFIGARSEIVEGVIVEQGAVISMGVFIGQSTKIYDLATDEVFTGRVPAGAVVVPGSMPSRRNPNINLGCAVIVKRVDEQTKSKVGLNQILRQALAEHGV